MLSLLLYEFFLSILYFVYTDNNFIYVHIFYVESLNIRI